MYEKGKKEIKVNKKILVLIILIIIFSLIFIVEEGFLQTFDSRIDSAKEETLVISDGIILLNEQIKQKIKDISDKQDEKNSTKLKLDLLNTQLEENNSELIQFKSGDDYHLYDPLYEEVKDFIKKDTNYDEWKLIENAKSRGLRCAYVMIYTEEGDSYPVVGFKTLDKGMVYYEAGTDYKVIPVIGNSYSSCVVGDPYLSTYNSIEDILVLW